ncbi:MAG: hypothetical protein CBB78_000080 [Roseibacillus sp. TMED18]|nr:MAG: hypothetical protein CBB78_000080 [Roseibacillus sp. TMED18]
MPGHLASGNTILTLRVGPEIKRWLFLLVSMKRGQTVADQEEGDDVFTTHGKWAQTVAGALTSNTLLPERTEKLSDTAHVAVASVTGMALG